MRESWCEEAFRQVLDCGGPPPLSARTPNRHPLLITPSSAVLISPDLTRVL